jgi:hypothetical protein
MPLCQSTGTVQIELEMEVGGEWERPDKSVGESVDSYYADRVESLTYQHTKGEPTVDERGSQTGYRIVKVGPPVDLLAGVDTRNPEVRKLLSNLLELYSDEANEALKEANVE